GANFGALVTAAPYTVSWNTTLGTGGSHTLSAIAKDTAGNSTTSGTITVTVDNQAPTVSITAPTASATVGGTVPLSANAADNVAVASVQFQLDGANLGSAVTTAPYSISWNASAVTAGNHSL